MFGGTIANAGLDRDCQAHVVIVRAHTVHRYCRRITGSKNSDPERRGLLRLWHADKHTSSGTDRHQGGLSLVSNNPAV
jgi:hypothetical protein